jgi:hypothetical protein
MQDTVQQLRDELAAGGDDYVCDGPLGGRGARLRFIGRYQDRDVVWDAELIALAADGGAAAQFLDIGAPGPRGVPISIGLGVSFIDRPTVLKAIVMVRNYKRLRPGRHEFGPAGPVAAERAGR